MCRVWDEEGYASEDTFYVTAEERVSLKMYNKNVPYITSGVSSCLQIPIGWLGLLPQSTLCLPALLAHLRGFADTDCRILSVEPWPGLLHHLLSQ